MCATVGAVLSISFSPRLVGWFQLVLGGEGTAYLSMWPQLWVLRDRIVVVMLALMPPANVFKLHGTERLLQACGKLASICLAARHDIGQNCMGSCYCCGALACLIATGAGS